MTNPIEAWIAAGQHGDCVEHLVMYADRLLARKNPVAKRPQLEAAVRAAAARRGVRHLRQAYELARAGTDSVMETWLRLRIIDAGLPEPEINQPIVTSYGMYIARLDMTFKRWRVAILYDGGQHRTSPKQWAKDHDDDHYLAQEGWAIVRSDFSHIHHPQTITDRVRAAIDSQVRRGVSPYRENATEIALMSR